jgi:hypothetical protein
LKTKTKRTIMFEEGDLTGMVTMRKTKMSMTGCWKKCGCRQRRNKIMMSLWCLGSILDSAKLHRPAGRP